MPIFNSERGTTQATGATDAADATEDSAEQGGRRSEGPERDPPTLLRRLSQLLNADLAKRACEFNFEISSFHFKVQKHILKMFLLIFTEHPDELHNLPQASESGPFH